MRKLSIKDIDSIKSKTVKMRVDFNVPLRNGQVENDKRLRASLPSIQYLLGQGARLVLMSHLGRPKGEVKPELSLAPVAEKLGQLLGQRVQFVEQCIGNPAQEAASKLQDGEVLLLENLRFHKQETDNDPDFAKDLAQGVDVYVNDAFGTAHRAHASTAGITEYIDVCAAGLLMQKELEFLGRAVANPEHPFVVISGGAKISDKITMIRNMLPKVDQLIVGGGMTYTFLKAQGLEIGKSLLEADKLDLARELIKLGGSKLILPSDSMAAETVDFETRSVGELQVRSSTAMQPDEMGLDIGPVSIASFTEIIKAARTIVWNGPMGVFEIADTAKGTFAIADALAAATAKGATTIIGGGDSAAAIEKAGLADKVSHVSTGGGASLEFLEGKELPGVQALSDA
ncbi:MAG: phosphoglycerate kinase [Leptospiraceae bacterium]|nr:phosphoglycerate kinase [Leptospiraceae bacterium]